MAQVGRPPFYSASSSFGRLSRKAEIAGKAPAAYVTRFSGAATLSQKHDVA
jgi:hypothetical protein